MDGNQKTLKSKVIEQTKGLVGAIIAAAFLRIFVLDNFYVPTGSMIPTVLIWDHLFATKWNYGWGKVTLPFFDDMFAEDQLRGRAFYTPPTRGEIVIFRVPNDPKDYIKRLIGVPGDKIQMKKGILHINGEAVKLERLEDYERMNERGDKKLAKQYLETLPGGVQHKIIHVLQKKEIKNGVPHIDGIPVTLAPLENGKFMLATFPNGAQHIFAQAFPDKAEYLERLDDSQEYVIPEKYFFMMGDNRNESGDSRFSQMGLIPEDYIKSKAQFVWLSTDGSAGYLPWKWPFAVRYSRFFQMIR